MNLTQRIPIGRVVGLYGVRGEVKIESWSDPRIRIFDFLPWYVTRKDGYEKEFEVVSGRSQGKGLVARLSGIEDRDRAQTWLDAEISVTRSKFPALPSGRWYWCDLEGLEVITLEGVSLGQVSRLIATGANDVMVVRDGKRERLVPFVNGVWVHSVDLSTGQIVVDWDPEF